MLQQRLVIENGDAYGGWKQEEMMEDSQSTRTSTLWFSDGNCSWIGNFLFRYWLYTEYWDEKNNSKLEIFNAQNDAKVSGFSRTPESWATAAFVLRKHLLT